MFYVSRFFRVLECSSQMDHRTLYIWSIRTVQEPCSDGDVCTPNPEKIRSRFSEANHDFDS